MDTIRIDVLLKIYGNKNITIDTYCMYNLIAFDHIRNDLNIYASNVRSKTSLKEEYMCFCETRFYR